MPRFETARGSLQRRLILIPACILCLGILAAIGVTLYGARTRIASEIESGINLGSLLIVYALDDVSTSSDPDAALQRLQHELAHVRHIKVEYVPVAAGVAAGAAAPNPEREAAPAWFQHIFEPERLVKSFPLAINGIRHGELVMSTKPADEIGEIWGSIVFLTALLTAVSVAIITLITLTARYTLRPLHAIEDGLDRLERGQFDALAEIRVADFQRIGAEFNRLARSLARTEADNRLLIDRLISIQEAERKEIARELHDEFGAALFGIRAAAACVVAACEDTPPAQAAEIIDRAEAISKLADGIQKQNYRILDRIRPMILDQMGLSDAVRQLVESWRAAHRDFTCNLEVPTTPPLFPEDVSLTSYRLVQEGLTNVARHSRARSVRVTMNYTSETPATGAMPARLRVSIEDDGIGLPADFRFGFGFLGMSERVRKLGGQLKVGNRPGSGTLIEAWIPVVETPPPLRRGSFVEQL